MNKFAKKLGSIALVTTMMAGALTGCGKAQNTEEGDKPARIQERARLPLQWREPGHPGLTTMRTTIW